jgi:hypothetical protein
VLGALVALLALTGIGLTACSDNTPATPSISGDSPEQVTVPTLPPTTTTAAPGTGETTETTAAPTTTEAP